MRNDFFKDKYLYLKRFKVLYILFLLILVTTISWIIIDKYFFNTSDKSDIEDLKQNIEYLTNKLERIQSQPIKNTTEISNGNQITSEEISNLLSGIVEITCKNTSGSGSLFKLENNQIVVLTNRHVVSNFNYDKTLDVNSCNILPNDENGSGLGILYVNTDLNILSNINIDIAMLPIFEIPLNHPAFEFKAYLSELNTNLSDLKYCPNEISIGSPVVSIGYPSSGNSTIELNNRKYNLSNRILSNGIISGYDRSLATISKENYVNYFVTSKIDSGNSGGITLSKYNGEICILGVPTWVNVGDYDTQGVIQNINNIFK